MRATKFEFERRFWIIAFIVFCGFSLYSFDRVNFAVGLLHLFAPRINPDGPRGIFFLRLIFAAGAALIFLAVLLRTWATAYLLTEIVHDVSQHSESLVADGPFRYVRNPLYLANLPMMAGIGVMASRLGWLFIVLGNWVFVYRLILREESALLESQGESYRAYLMAVPRFWPAFTPRVPSGGHKPRWGQAFVGEMAFWLFGLAVLSFAFTLNLKLTWIVYAFAFLVYFVTIRFFRKRTAISGANPIPPA
jgi:protein-S-isoprenylcysteine O-methyltransferase Ste14